MNPETKQRRWGRYLLPDFMLFAGTRVALGMGIGLLLSRRMNNDQRKAAGIALAATAGLTTVPLAMRFSMLRQWKRERARAHGGGQCSCGCEFCCPPERRAASPDDSGEAAPAA